MTTAFESIEDGVPAHPEMDRPRLLLSLQRALLGNVYAELRQASIEASRQTSTISLRFEYDGEPSVAGRESGSVVAA